MRIGMMTDNFSTHISGVTNSIKLITRCLEEAGHEVYIFTFNKFGGISKEQNMIYTNGIPISDFYFNIRYNQNAKQLLSSMDIVHVHHPFISGLLAKRYCLPLKIPIVFTNHTRYDLYSKIYLPFIPTAVINAVLKAYLSQFYASCDLVIVPSESVLQILQEKFGLHSTYDIIPNGLELSLYYDRHLSVDRTGFGVSREDVICIYIGRLAPEKNLPFLVNAFHNISLVNSHVKLLLVGDGPERKKLEAQVNRQGFNSKVIFTGFVSYNDVPRYLLASDIFVAPSSTEVCSLSTIEAMAAGLPVLGIDSSGMKDIIENGVNGYITRNDLSSFTEKLMQLSFDASLRKSLGRHAISTSMRYDIRLTTAKLINHYENLLQVKNRRYKLSKN